MLNKIEKLNLNVNVEVNEFDEDVHYAVEINEYTVT